MAHFGARSAVLMRPEHQLVALIRLDVKALAIRYKTFARCVRRASLESVRTIDCCIPMTVIAPTGNDLLARDHSRIWTRCVLRPLRSQIHYPSKQRRIGHARIERLDHPYWPPRLLGTAASGAAWERIQWVPSDNSEIRYRSERPAAHRRSPDDEPPTNALRERRQSYGPRAAVASAGLQWPRRVS